MRTPTTLRGWLAALAPVVTALAAAFGLVVVIDDGGTDRPPSITVTLGGPGQEQITLGPSGQQLRDQAAAGDVGDHAGARSETPDGVPRADLDQAQDQRERLAETDQLPIVTPNAAPEQRGCRSRFVRNKSNRGGVRPRLFVLHYTVSANRSGWGDVDAITSLFDRASFQASSHYVVDAEGNCSYIVKESDKAWTQASYNPVSLSVEIINTGREGRLVDAAGLSRLGQVVSDATKRWDIPLQTAKVSGCTVVRPGVIDHRSLGACGGGHTDIAPYAVAPVLAAAQAARGGATASSAAPGSLTKGERSAASCLLAERRSARRNGGWSKIATSHLARASRCKAQLERANQRLHKVGLKHCCGRSAALVRARNARHDYLHRVL